MIKFLGDHQTGGVPVEKFTGGQIVKGREPESELHFVRRRVAAYLTEDGALYDHEGKPVADPFADTKAAKGKAKAAEGEA